MHSRTDIIKNQKEFGYEIKKWLKKDFSDTQIELKLLDSKDAKILEMKKGLESKFKKVDIKKYINKLFINENNIYPKFYAWWDEIEQTVKIIPYEA